MKQNTLDIVIEQELKDPCFAEHYHRELLINNIAKVVLSLREKHCLTQAELAKRSGTTQPAIARIESGSDSRIPSLDLLTRIAYAANAKIRISFEDDK